VCNAVHAAAFLETTALGPIADMNKTAANRSPVVGMPTCDLMIIYDRTGNDLAFQDRECEGEIDAGQVERMVGSAIVYE
jgi:hypothetical protein